MRKVAPARASTEAAYAQLAADLGAETSAMFGMPALKLAGKAFAGLFGDAIVFKLDGTHHATALALAGAELFDPSGSGRAMKAWVVVPSAHATRWPALGAAAAAALAGAAKPRKR
jgi:hypothetical protein